MKHFMLKNLPSALIRTDIRISHEFHFENILIFFANYILCFSLVMIYILIVLNCLTYVNL